MILTTRWIAFLKGQSGASPKWICFRFFITLFYYFHFIFWFTLFLFRVNPILELLSQWGQWVVKQIWPYF